MDMATCLAHKKELASQLNEPGLPAKDLEDTAQDSGSLVDDRESQSVHLEENDKEKVVSAILKQKTGCVVCSHLLIRVISTITV